MEEIDNSLILKVKHFGRDLNAWEEKDEWFEFKLIRIEDQTAWFNGLVLHREADRLTIKLAMRSKGESWIEEFSYTKQKI